MANEKGISRALLWVVGANIVLLAVGAVLGESWTGQYNGGPVALRPWLFMVSAVVASALVIVNGLSAILTWRADCGRPGPVILGFGALASLAYLIAAFPYRTGEDPLSSRALFLLRILVFVPLLARALGWALIALRVHRGRLALLAAIAFTGDLAATAAALYTTPIEIIPRLQSFPLQPVFLAPLVLGWLALAVGLLAAQSEPEPGSDSDSETEGRE
ncbi:MAG: hypothetical protein KC561_14600 [Myxococcales bacterium]|nr:hypothetical protein [Myxococcales bacterium]